eukprot:TRINITY_DN8686_c0_g1_i1.p1 TRINITY_DN8686_c0_g1~~TRINITY_DN8686_c0_g1_i1.p1  ORF type:complete len:478 (+),score=74.15 TRINITY_DN8686_c0_g1_i1:77-1510(+)
MCIRDRYQRRVHGIKQILVNNTRYQMDKVLWKKTFSGEDSVRDEEEEEGFHMAKIEIKQQNDHEKIQHVKLPLIGNTTLPEALPICESNLHKDFQPRLLLQNMQLSKTPDILNTYGNNNQISLAENEEAIQNSPQNPKTVRYKTLYDKYENSKFYKRMYQKHPDQRLHHDILQNFAGFYINLSHLMDFGKSMFSMLQDPQVNKTKFPQEDSFQENQQQNEGTIEYTQLVFDSRFESGNLYAAYTRQDNIYDLIMQNDINTKGYTQWFYFNVSNTKANQTVRFNIVNFSKKDSPFRYGMKPAIFSLMDNQATKTCWVKGGDNVRYFKNKIIKEQNLSSESCYYTLSFTYTFRYTNDIVYFAMNYPYPFTKSIQHIDNVMNELNKNEIYFQKEILCYSISQTAVPLLTITNAGNVAQCNSLLENSLSIQKFNLLENCNDEINSSALGQNVKQSYDRQKKFNGLSQSKTNSINYSKTTSR